MISARVRTSNEKRKMKRRRTHVESPVHSCAHGQCTRQSACYLAMVSTDNRGSNFGRLVLLCIDSYDCEKRRILQHFSRSTKFAFFSRPYFQIFANFRETSSIC